jgi:hypothetical protein
MIVKHMVTNKARRLPKCCKHKGWTYVVAGGDLVKIGRTTGKVMARMYGIQGASPARPRVPLTLSANAERCGWCRHWHDPMAVCVRGSKTA